MPRTSQRSNQKIKGLHSLPASGPSSWCPNSSGPLSWRAPSPTRTRHSRIRYCKSAVVIFLVRELRGHGRDGEILPDFLAGNRHDEAVPVDDQGQLADRYRRPNPQHANDCRNYPDSSPSYDTSQLSWGHATFRRIFPIKRRIVELTRCTRVGFWPLKSNSPMAQSSSATFWR